MKEGLFEKSLHFLREAFIHHPKAGEIHIKMAVCHLKLGNRELAARFLEEALSHSIEGLSEFKYYFQEEGWDEDIRWIIRKYKK